MQLLCRNVSSCRGPARTRSRHEQRVKPCHSTHRFSHSHDNEHEQVLGPTVTAKIGDLDKLQFQTATVTRNEALNLDGSSRLIHLSIDEDVQLTYGRGGQGVVDSQRWIDSYTMPGQFVAIKNNGRLLKRLHSIASTPYESRRDSSYVSSSLIEVVACTDIGTDDVQLAELGPGAQLEISNVVGRGFSALLSSNNTILTALEEGRPVLCIAVGMRGMVPIRALLSWTPMLAHATARKVSCLYVERAPTTAGFVVEWDKWREAGIGLHTTYLGEDGDLTDEARVMEALDSGLFLREGGFNSLAGSASECLVVMAGLTGVQASNVCKRLGAKGVRHERMLFADFF